MALKPTIFKLRIALSDLNQDYYESFNLTVAQHPSEKLERMMVRILAFCINAYESSSFTRGISATQEPDLWSRTLDDKLVLWIDVGEPAVDRLKKATRIAQRVKIYCFNTKSNVWWSQSKASFNKLSVSVYQFYWEEIQSLTTLVERTMDISVTITGESAYFATNKGECEINWITLQESRN